MMRLIDAYYRGYLTYDEYITFLNEGYTNNSKIYINVTSFTDLGLPFNMRLIKRDPDILLELEFVLQDASADSEVYSQCAVDGILKNYAIFTDLPTNAAFDICVGSEYAKTKSIVGDNPPIINYSTYTTGNPDFIRQNWKTDILANDYIKFMVTKNSDANHVNCVLTIEPSTQYLALE
jgi:hypothetical protein